MTDLKTLTELLTDHGYEFEVRPDDYGLEIVVQVAVPEVELPEELKPFERNPDEIERAMWKGHGQTKQTFEGVNFEFALQDYAHHIFEQDPRVIEHELTLDDRRDLEDLNAYQFERKALWDEIINTREDIARWEAELERLY